MHQPICNDQFADDIITSCLLVRSAEDQPMAIIYLYKLRDCIIQKAARDLAIHIVCIFDETGMFFTNSGYALRKLLLNQYI